MITVYIDQDYSTLGADATQADLDGYAANLAAHLTEKFGRKIDVEQVLGGARGGMRCSPDDDEISDYVQELEGTDGWLELLPAPSLTRRRVTITLDVNTDCDDATLVERLANYLTEEGLDESLIGDIIRFDAIDLRVSDPPGWTYERYWEVVLGDRDAAGVLREFDLSDGSRRGLDEWLGTAEADAWIMAGNSGELPAEWRAGAFHERALDELEAAALGDAEDDDAPDSERTQRADHVLDQAKDSRVRGEQ